MKSFVATLMQPHRYTPREVKTPAPLITQKKLEAITKAGIVAHAVRDAAVAEKYLKAIGTARVSTAEIAAAVESTPTNVIKQLNRLVARRLIKRDGTLQVRSSGRPAVMWKATGDADAKHPDNIRWHHTVDDTYIKAVALVDRDTAEIAKQVGVDYYTALARLKTLEEMGSVKRVGVNRRVKEAPSIIWAMA